MKKARALKLPVPSEHESQKAFFARVSLDPRTKYLPIFAIANGGHRHISVAKKLKAEGVKAGVPDIFLAMPKVDHYRVTMTSNGEQGGVGTEYMTVRSHGLFIEMKKQGNKLSPAQMEWISSLNLRGYQVAVCYSADFAWITLCDYLGLTR